MAGWPGPNWLESLITTTSQASRSRVLGDERVEILAADFFFAFDQEFELHRQPAERFEPGLGAFDMREHLAFVVGGAAGIDVAVAASRLERRRNPFGRADRRGCTS